MGIGVKSMSGRCTEENKSEPCLGTEGEIVENCCCLCYVVLLFVDYGLWYICAYMYHSYFNKVSHFMSSCYICANFFKVCS